MFPVAFFTSAEKPYLEHKAPPTGFPWLNSFHPEARLSQQLSSAGSGCKRPECAKESC